MAPCSSSTTADKDGATPSPPHCCATCGDRWSIYPPPTARAQGKVRKDYESEKREAQKQKTAWKKLVRLAREEAGLAARPCQCEAPA